MKQFEKWLKLTQEGYVKDMDGNMWPCFGTLTTIDEAECAKMGWKAALEWALNENGGDCDWHLITQELEDLKGRK